MRLSYAFLADAAQFSVDGKLGVLGGDISVVRAIAFPAMQPGLTLVVKLAADAEEAGKAHRVRIRVTDPEDAEIFGIEGPVMAVANPDLPDFPIGVGLTVRFDTLKFPKDGDYLFHILLDTVELINLPVRALKVPAAVVGIEMDKSEVPQ